MMDAGIYSDLSNADYHAQVDWLSAGRIKHYLPEHFKPSTGASPALDFGIAFHSLILGGPSEPLAVVNAATWQGKAAQEERRIAQDAGKVPLLSKDVPVLDGMEQAIRNHPEAAALLFDEPGTPEVSVFTEWEGNQVKCRFDRLLDSGVAVDLKTTASKPGAENLRRAVLDYGYDVQAAHYVDTGQAAGLDVDELVFVFVGKEPPFHVTVVSLDEMFYERGRALRDLGVERMLHPDMVDPYPGATGRLNLSPPPWARW